MSNSQFTWRLLYFNRFLFYFGIVKHRSEKRKILREKNDEAVEIPHFN